MTNYGPSVSSNVQVSVTLPSGVTLISSNVMGGSINGTLWNIGTLNTNAGAQLILTVRPNYSSNFTSTAFVNASTPDPNSDDNFASATLNAGIVPAPSLSGAVTKSGGQFLFSITSGANQTNVIQVFHESGELDSDLHQRRALHLYERDSSGPSGPVLS